MFQGRYKSILIEKENYLLEVSRYVVLNPVRARMVNDVADWSWSSYLPMVSGKASPEWLETDWLLSQFGSSRKKAIKSYIDFVRAGVGQPPVWENLKGQMFLGSDSFIEKAQASRDENSDDFDLKEVPRIQRRPLVNKLEWYQGNYPARNKAMRMAYLSGDYSMKEIADYFKVHYSTVSRAVNNG